MVENAIEIKDLYKAYKETKAVNGISFCVKKGKAYAFLGCNGAGKSTTINMIAGILTKDSGDILVYGKDIEESSDYKQNLGLVFQNSVLDKKLTVKENLYNKAILYGLSKQQIQENIKGLAQALDFQDILDRAVEKLSGGQVRRVDLARALVHNPAILILDEPTTGLDPQTRKLVWKFINELKTNSGLTIVLTTHYMEEAADMDNVIIIDGGKILVEGSPSQLKTQYTSDCVKLYNIKNQKATILKLKKLGYEATQTEDYIQFFIKDSKEIKIVMEKCPELFEDFEVIKGKMDDVFLNVTGKNLEGIANV